MNILASFAVILLSYVFGSISSAIVVCKVAGLPDPRTTGSNNPGATNVLRIGGKKYAFLTLLGDVLKGLVPVAFVVVFAQTLAPWVVAAVMVAAFLGHLFPVFFNFQGGKGVAIAFGVVFGLSWQLGLLVTAVWFLVAGLFRYSSLAGISAFLLAPLLYLWFFAGEWAITVALFIIALGLLWRHKANIHRLLHGIEPKIGK